MRRKLLTDFSGLEKYLGDDKSYVKVPVADCLLVDDCRLNDGQTLAIFKAGGRMFLFCECGMGTPGYVYVSTKLLIELTYASLEEALADTHCYGTSKEEIREIDSLAYGLYCDLYR